MPFQPFHPLKKNVPKLTRRKINWGIQSCIKTGKCNTTSFTCSKPWYWLAGNWNTAKWTFRSRNWFISFCRECGTPWKHSRWKLKGHSNFSGLYDILLNVRKIWSFLCINTLTYFCSCTLHSIWSCSAFSGVTCIKCGNPMDKELKIMVNDSSSEVTHRHEDGAFVKGEAMYLIFDDLKVLQSSPRIFVKELVQLGYKDFNNLTEIYQNVGLKELQESSKYQYHEQLWDSPFSHALPSCLKPRHCHS
ncbi:uncharacterized protein [Arachis hypogaea]|uniref:uncharacterized protein isoform X2 n=1 Tax=Arachis hypogaea TaxID=3818 RepID=UPI0011057513|nr:uncharacterized protein LOC112776481 [Arachis hypogaea]XP_029151485.1 uncharacterized protein LOC112776481 [Arachis hypogaea]